MQRDSLSLVHSGKILILLFVFFCSGFARANAFLAADQERQRLRLRQAFGSLNLNAEQRQIDEVPRPSNLLNFGLSILRTFSADWDRQGNIPAIYLPEKETIFNLPVAALPVDEYDFYAVNEQSAARWRSLFLNEQGQILVPFHPYQVEKDSAIAALIANSPGDLPLLFSPTSSTRSGYVLPVRQGVIDEELVKGLILKLSLPASTSGSNRMIGRKGVARALLTSQHLAQALRKTQSRLPITGSRWLFFPEDGAIVRKGDDRAEGARILRNRPFDPRKHEFVPAYFLNVKDRHGKKYVQQLFEASGETDFANFVIEKLILPAWELHLYLAFVEGHPPATHGQNNGYLVDRATGLIDAHVMQDLSLPVSAAIRWIHGLDHQFHLPPGLTLEDLDLKEGREAVLASLEYFKDMYVDQVFSLILNDSQLGRLRQRRLEVLQSFAQNNFAFRPTSFDNFISVIREKMLRADQVGVGSSNAPTPSNSTSSSSSLINIVNIAETPGSVGVTTAKASSNRVETLFSPSNEPVAAIDEAMTRLGIRNADLLPSPYRLSVSATESNEIERGASQRMRAMSLFFRDVLAGGTRWKRVMNEESFNFLLRVSGVSRDYFMSFAGDDLTLFMGADFLRDETTGRIIYLEDQIYPAPGRLAFAEMARRAGQLREDSRQVQSFYSQFEEFYRHAFREAHGRDPHIVVLDYHPNATLGLIDSGISSDQSVLSFDRKAIAESSGLDLVTVGLEDKSINAVDECVTGLISNVLSTCRSPVFNDRDPRTGMLLRLKAGADGKIHVERKSPGGALTQSEPVDIILNRIMFSGDLDRDPYKMTLNALSPEVQKAVDQRKVELSSHPMALIASNKLFQTYVEKMIREYLGEEPVFRLPRFKKFVTVDGRFSATHFDQIFNHLDQWVIKRIVGFGGKQTFIGKDLSEDPSALRKLKDQVRAQPQYYVAYAYHAPSQVTHAALPFGKANVHFRYFSALYGDQTFVSPHGMTSLSPPESHKSNRASGSVFAITETSGCSALLNGGGNGR